MKVLNMQDVQGTEFDVSVPGEWRSLRYITAADDVGFSMNLTVIPAGACLSMQYKNHIEAVFCISGSGLIVDEKDMDVHPITKGTMYLLNDHDKHQLKALDELVLVCVFNPPLVGNEVHDEDGSYPLPTLE